MRDVRPVLIRDPDDDLIEIDVLLLDGLARPHELEALGYLHMALQQPLGTGSSSTVKVLP